MNRVFAAMLCFIFCHTLSGQEVWSLERCIREALDKSLGLQQVELFRDGLEIDAKQLRMERLPNLNGSSNFGVSFGRVINPVTNDVETENSFYQSLGLNSGVMVFNGFRLSNTIKRTNLLLSVRNRYQFRWNFCINGKFRLLAIDEHT